MKDKRIEKIEAMFIALKRDGFPKCGFRYCGCSDGGRIIFDRDIETSYLEDDYENVFILEKGKLERFLTCRDCGNEGIEKELKGFDLESGLCKECSKWKTEKQFIL